MSATDSQSARLRELAVLFFKLGTFGFGGPAAHLALVEDEVVRKRGWLSPQEFLDLVGATNLIPGPNSTEMAIHIGRVRAGLPGLIVAGVCFIAPAAVLSGMLALLYLRGGNLSDARGFLFGIKPAMIAIMAGLIWKLGRKAVKDWRLALVGAATTVASFQGADELVALFASGLVGMFWLRMRAINRNSTDQSLPLLATGWLAQRFIPSARAQLAYEAAISLPTTVGPGRIDATITALAIFFLKVGSILYGSGYVLIAFIEGDLVRDHGWLTKQQLLDAVAVGQVTPGPLFSTATFIGYIVMAKAGGSPIAGAAVATIAIFLPAFILVAVTGPLISRLRRSSLMAAFLDAINVSSIALMFAVVLKLAQEVFWAENQPAGWPAWMIAVVAAVASLVLRINAAIVIIGSGLIGLVLARAHLI